MPSDGRFALSTILALDEHAETHKPGSVIADLSDDYHAVLAPSGDTTGVTDRQNVVSLLALLGYVKLKPGGAFYLDQSVTLASYQAFIYSGATVNWVGGNAPVVTTVSWAANAGSPETSPVVLGTGGTINGDASQGPYQHGVLLRCVYGVIDGGTVVAPGGHGQGFTCCYSNGFSPAGQSMPTNRIRNADAQQVSAGIPILLGESAATRSIAATASLTSGSTTLTDSAGLFSAIDLGRTVTNANIPAGTVITTVSSRTTVTMSAAATGTASSQTVTVGALTDSAGGTVVSNGVTDGIMDNCKGDVAGTTNALPYLHCGNAGGWTLGDFHGFGVDGSSAAHTVTAIYIRGATNTRCGRWYIGHFLTWGVMWDGATGNLNLGDLTVNTDSAGASGTSAVISVSPAGGLTAQVTYGSLNINHGSSTNTVNVVFDATTTSSVTMAPGPVTVTGTHPEHISWTTANRGFGLYRPCYQITNKVYAGTGTVTVASSSWAAIDATNLKVTFVAPITGAVNVILDGFATPGSGNTYAWALLDGGAPVSAAAERAIGFGDTNPKRYQCLINISGLVPNQVYTWTWGHARTGGSGTCTFRYDTSSLEYAAMDVKAA
jgi:hypothetical protein